MAMGQGEQRAIHPFFQRGFGGSTKPIPCAAANDSLLYSTNSRCESQEVLDEQTSTSHDPTIHATCNNTLVLHDDTTVATLDHDPNIHRRKRQKTAEFSSKEARPASCLEGEAPPVYVEALEGIASLTNPKNPESDTPDEAQHVANREAQNEESIVQQDSDPQNKNKSHLIHNHNPNPKRKMIKLNPNGKLLSSPVAEKFRDKTKERQGTKRGKSELRKSVEREIKLVTISYYNAENFSTGIGKQINDILSGITKYPLPNACSKHSSAATLGPVKAQPLKPTHPFFLKKSTRKPEPLVGQLASNNGTLSESDQREPKETETPHSPRSFHTIVNNSSIKPPPSFGRHLRKFPEPVQPAWPPRGLTHVRDNGDKPDAEYDDSFVHVNIYEKKSKMAAIRISDKESVLSPLTHPPSSTPQSLRVPRRQVASGRVLQEIIAKQLSGHASKTTEDEILLPEISHPAVTNMYSLLGSSMTAFDLGGFETQLWTQKYAPHSVRHVLCGTKEALMLRDWLKNLMVSTVDTGKGPKDDEKRKRKEEKRRKKRKKSEKLDGFIVSSADEDSEMGEITGSEDELAGDATIASNKKTVIRTGDLTFNLRSGADRSRMSNAILLSGPPGCGKTASVYAVAKELDFEVFEINAGNRRSAKDIVERVGDMTQNHLVHNMNDDQDQPKFQPGVPDSKKDRLTAGKPNKLNGFFQPLAGQGAKKATKEKTKPGARDTCTQRTRNKKQSLILLEEADLLFEEDKNFWAGVLTVINQSKRPIIITCNDEGLIPLDNISFHAILRYRTPPLNLAIDYLLLVAANEGHILNRGHVESLYKSTGNDLRKSIMELNFWCQMAVGSEKSGLDWMIDRWPRGSDLDSDGHPLRVLSLNTYMEYMGWFSRDMLMSHGMNSEVVSQQEALHWWQLSPQDSESLEEAHCHTPLDQGQSASRLNRLDSLQRQASFMEARSALDSLTTCCSTDPQMDVIDTSVPPISEKQKSSYIEGYKLLNADSIADSSPLSAQIGCTLGVLIGKIYRQKHESDAEATLATKVLANISKPKRLVSPAGLQLFQALAPISKSDYVSPQPTGRQAPSFENGLLGPIAEDLGPYVRAIVAFDIRLEQYRLQLSGVLSRDAKGTKRVRTTRASRAALEGGTKAETRKEKWFSPDINPSRILATGKKEWQDLLVRNGHFTVASSTGEPKEDSNQRIMEGVESLSEDDV